MKKLLGLAIFVACLFVSCTLNYPNNTVLTNHSSREVTVNFTGAGEIILAPSGYPYSTRTVTTLGNMNPGERMQSFSPNRRVFFRYTNSSLAFEFFDLPSFQVNILNLTGQEGVLTADEWMDEISFTNSSTEQTNAAWLVYTSRPRFTARSGDFLLPVLWDRVGDIFTVTIGN